MGLIIEESQQLADDGVLREMSVFVMGDIPMLI